MCHFVPYYCKFFFLFQAENSAAAAFLVFPLFRNSALIPAKVRNINGRKLLCNTLPSLKIWSPNTVLSITTYFPVPSHSHTLLSNCWAAGWHVLCFPVHTHQTVTGTCGNAEVFGTEKLGRQGHCSITMSIMHCYLQAFIPPKIFAMQSPLVARTCKTQAQKSPAWAASYIKHTLAKMPQNLKYMQVLKGKYECSTSQVYRKTEIWLYKEIFNSAEC